jgi:hypothetical protein
VVSEGQPDAREGQAGRAGVTERSAVLRKPGNAGGGKGPQYKTDATQDVVRDLEIGQPINSEECSEAADGVARESEGRSRLSFYALYDKISREDVLAHAYAQCLSNKGAWIDKNSRTLKRMGCNDSSGRVRGCRRASKAEHQLLAPRLS